MKYNKSLLAIASLLAFNASCSAVIYQLSDTTTGDEDKSKYPTSANIDSDIVGTFVLSEDTHTGWTGIDYSFTGRMVANFTLNVMSTNSSLDGAGAVNLDFYDNSGGDRVIAIGNPWFSPNFGYWKAPRDNDQNADLLDVTGQPIAIYDPVSELAQATESFVLTIEYVAGGIDSGTILMADGINALPPGDYSFTEIMAGSYNAPTTFSDMTVEVIPEGDGTPVTMFQMIPTAS